MADNPVLECARRALELARYVEAGRVTDPSDNVGWVYVVPTLVSHLSVLVDDLESIGEDHFVIFTPTAWTVEHSFGCRLSGRMSECSYHQAIAEVYDEPVPASELGRWRITEIDEEGLPSLVRVGGANNRDREG